MSVYITDEHFRQVWFLYKEGEERKRLLRLQDDLFFSIFIASFDDSEEIYPAIEDRHVDILKEPYTWLEKPRIRFSLHGIDLGKGKIINNTSFYEYDNPLMAFFNAEIFLPEITDSIGYLRDISLDELITYAKYRWCKDMDLLYIHAQEAIDIENRIIEATDIIEGRREEPENEYQVFINKLRLMPYQLYLQTEHWKHFREEAIKFYQSKCQLCGNIERQSYNLHLHHNNYSNRGRETFNDVILLCASCHRSYHKK
ncbi:HNH endonuclease signature motif containing protein [Paenibacillus brasilensis]|uniref:HNH domain-containing protein n=1 Tax=Paenibacillus brasilensis TaxID=128574 RepID=A0ABU0L660_9BACL|nr:HNH endonuclease signature motif containing protein [Paenibacillus brasilensis]MDQ0496788.1 hypothetical protein [Paenibacillus brasilensis]